MMYRGYRIEQEGNQWALMNLRKVVLAYFDDVNDAFKAVDEIKKEVPSGKK
jgi:hypothetical protein